MSKYEVEFATTKRLTVKVTADTELEAVELAYEEIPEPTAYESGAGSGGIWSASQDEFMLVDEFYELHGGYDERRDGRVIRKVG